MVEMRFGKRVIERSLECAIPRMRLGQVIIPLEQGNLALRLLGSTLIDGIAAAAIGSRPLIVRLPVRPRIASAMAAQALAWVGFRDSCPRLGDRPPLPELDLTKLKSL